MRDKMNDSEYIRILGMDNESWSDLERNGLLDNTLMEGWFKDVEKYIYKLEVLDEKPYRF